MEINTVFEQAVSQCLNNPSIYEEMRKFEMFVERVWQVPDLATLLDDIDHIRRGFLKRQNNACARDACDIFTQVVNAYSMKKSGNTEESGSLYTNPIYNKLNRFKTIVDMHHEYGRTRFHSSFAKEYHPLLRWEQRVHDSEVPFMSEHLMTGYHQSGLSLSEYIEQNQLFAEMRKSGNVLVYNEMCRYLGAYSDKIAEPLPHYSQYPLELPRYQDNMSVLTTYFIEINNGIKNILCNNANTRLPLQLDVFVVSPNCSSDVDLHNLQLNGLQSNTKTRQNGAFDGHNAAYRLIRQASRELNKNHGQRLVMLIVRGNVHDSNDDTLYIFEDEETSIPSGMEGIDLVYLLNSKGVIVDGLQSNDEGVLGLTHHIHASDCCKVYLSYGNHKSRVFKHDILNKLCNVCDTSDATNSAPLKKKKREEFERSYEMFEDTLYSDHGKYFFSIAHAYQCFEPYWNPRNCRAMANVFIPKCNPSCTEELKEYVDEPFESAKALYYKIDYTIGMQSVDEEIIAIRLQSGRVLTVINTDLHKNGEILYAVVVKNEHRVKQRWRIIDYQHISDAFMTAKQLKDTYGIFAHDLPKGSKAKHNGFQHQMDNIQVTKQLIKKTSWYKVRIVQSKQNLGKLGVNSLSSSSVYYNKNTNNTNNNGDNDNSVLRISQRRFQQLALKSLAERNARGESLIPIAHFKFRKNKYHLEKLLPVYIPNVDKWVAISFSFGPSLDRGRQGRTQASGVCLDLVDMKNKANLIEIVPNDCWLNCINEQNTINNLTIVDDDIMPSVKPKTKAKKSRSKQNKQQKQKTRTGNLNSHQANISTNTNTNSNINNNNCNNNNHYSSNYNCDNGSNVTIVPQSPQPSMATTPDMFNNISNNSNSTVTTNANNHNNCNGYGNNNITINIAELQREHAQTVMYFSQFLRPAIPPASIPMIIAVPISTPVSAPVSTTTCTAATMPQLQQTAYYNGGAFVSQLPHLTQTAYY